MVKKWVVLCFYKILNSKFNTIRKQSIVHISLPILGKTCIRGHHSWAKTTLEKVIRNQDSHGYDVISIK